MKIILVHNTYQQPGGEDIVFDQEKRMLELAGHHVVTYSRSNHEIGNLNILGQIGIAKRTVWASDTLAAMSHAWNWIVYNSAGLQAVGAIIAAALAVAAFAVLRVYAWDTRTIARAASNQERDEFHD